MATAMPVKFVCGSSRSSLSSTCGAGLRRTRVRTCSCMLGTAAPNCWMNHAPISQPKINSNIELFLSRYFAKEIVSNNKYSNVGLLFFYTNFFQLLDDPITHRCDYLGSILNEVYCEHFSCQWVIFIFGCPCKNGILIIRMALWSLCD